MPAPRLLTALLGGAGLVLSWAAPARADLPSKGGEARDGSIGVWVSSGNAQDGPARPSGTPALKCTYNDSYGMLISVTWDFDGIAHDLKYRVCNDGTMTAVWIPRRSATDLAAIARDDARQRLPRPAIGLAPAPGRGVVHVATWIWTTTPWQPVTVTAAIPGLSATVTATPVRLRFDPGDATYGSGPLACAGPGQPWQPAYGDHTPSACMYTYRHASSLHPTGRWPATMSIDWTVTFAASDGTAGTLDPLTTTTVQPITVGEIQALVTSAP